tara:strand:- start:2792 stop:3703 length:912 start_codon:yes stop_codon:yes gene_type:complete
MSNDDEPLPVDSSLALGKFDASFESVADMDERKPVGNCSEIPWARICSLEYYDDEASIWAPMGTGWIAAPRLVVTAGHCLFHPKRTTERLTKIRVIPGRHEGDFPFGCQESTEFKAAWEELGVEKDDRHDYGAIFVPKPWPKRLGRFRQMKVADPNELIGQKVNVGGYPGDFKLGLGQKQYRHADVVTRVADGRVFYKTDSSKGQSGSPIFVVQYPGDDPQVVGIHSDGFAKDAAEGEKVNSGPLLAQDVAGQIIAWQEKASIIFPDVPDQPPKPTGPDNGRPKKKRKGLFAWFGKGRDSANA